MQHQLRGFREVSGADVGDNFKVPLVLDRRFENPLPFLEGERGELARGTEYEDAVRALSQCVHDELRVH